MPSDGWWNNVPSPFLSPQTGLFLPVRYPPGVLSETQITTCFADVYPESHGVNENGKDLG